MQYLGTSVPLKARPAQTWELSIILAFTPVPLTHCVRFVRRNWISVRNASNKNCSIVVNLCQMLYIVVIKLKQHKLAIVKAISSFRENDRLFTDLNSFQFVNFGKPWFLSNTTFITSSSDLIIYQHQESGHRNTNKCIEWER